MDLNDLHFILFNMHIFYSIALGIWAAYMAVQSEPISGGYWGALLIGSGLAAVVTLVGVVMTLQGLRPQRIVIYYLYMAFLIVIMPGLFSLMRGRDDRSAAIAFSILAFFNATTSFSMVQRSILGPWLLPDAF
ncbi:MAG: hypothetical protein CL610_19095 [Anaerolineaceae bacterium]|nr:hypothetical protein [Anaerolineaceae bacterium]